MVTRNNKQRSNKRRFFVALLIVLSLIALGIFLYKQNQRSNTNDPVLTNEGEGVNLSPPTETDKQEAEDHKQNLIDNDQPAPPPADDKQQATPIFGYLDQSSDGNVVANGYISSAIESDGTCTLTLERGGQKLTTSRQAMPDAQSTICGQMSIDRSKLSAGDWKATISYSSVKYQGTSAERSIRVN